MFISKYSVEDWQGNRNHGSARPAQTWDEIETAIRSLDEHHKTPVTLETEDETHLAVGGGQGKYLVYLTFDNEKFHYLSDSSKQDEQENLVVGGQSGLYPAKYCVTLTTALKAAKTFVEFGVMEATLHWKGEEAFELVS
ncbi:Imm1 family immunity protein [Leptolyngbya boryana CZ1]|uniref:Imm1 family immunity protein n=1 Tax=Leptolyngbya boryana CZ1 TaxID=3060204 RepID=A0AA96WWK6_LEPBY|nr:Imm1 family immunity protein [Leptolyngbya boryana]WNZ47100.1 Imm1 family immunity protein [Leptolyngbya boryana CZ1]